MWQERKIKPPTGECEHCVPRVLYECERFKVEQTPTGKQWTIYNGQMHSAVTEYRNWLNSREKE